MVFSLVIIRMLGGSLSLSRIIVVTSFLRQLLPTSISFVENKYNNTNPKIKRAPTVKRLTAFSVGPVNTPCEITEVKGNSTVPTNMFVHLSVRTKCRLYIA